MHESFLKPYDHSKEKEIYKAWEESGFFSPENLASANNGNFSIIMPPPNANGSLHVGHAVMIAVEDILIRYQRLKGKKTLWLPGADHAGFETQVVFEKKLEKEGSSRFEILKEENGREKLYQMIWDFTQTNKSHMENQIRQIGASCDWTKEKFTLDKDIVKTVYQTFKKLYDDGLVYRDKRLVNYCVKHQTSLSDLEVSWEEKEDKLYFVKYLFREDKNSHITIATTRPETIPGDVAVAVNPNDKRFSDFIGKKVIEPITKKVIPIIADEAVEMEFGTGALKITPSHDLVDFEVGKRHNLENISIIDLSGKLNYLAGELSGLKISEARIKAVEILEKENVLEKIENYKHQVGVCYKCRNTVEPMILSQWFIDLTKKGKEKIIKPAIDAVKSGDIKIFPDFQEKIFFHWLENIRDWNISRQIVWGIPIPAWYCKNNGGESIISENKPDLCPFCGKCEMKKEEDVFDTWFSSGQWPYATLLKQGEISNKELKENNFGEFYPTSVMETGYDILFFWVARMIMLGIYTTGKVPFKNVYLHGLVRDKDKQKMSKSKGNVVDPLGVVEQYGADALRMALVVGNSAGQDVIYDENKIKGYRNFSNKLWNIARFILSQIEEGESMDGELLEEDKKIFDECEKVKKEVAENIEKFRFSQAAETAYHYVWHNLADKIIESKKKIVIDKENKDSKERKSSILLLYKLLYSSLIMLHPFMPFVTENIYQKLPIKNKKFLMVEEWGG